MTSNFAIVNLRDGQRRDTESFLLQNDAFPILENMFLFRGRLRRRSAFIHIGNDGRVKANVGTTNGAGNLTVTLEEGTFGIAIPVASSQFTVTDGITTQIFTDQGGASPVTMLATGAGIATLNRATGVLTITGSVATANVFYFPGIPIMGLRTKEAEPQAINDELLIAFDQRYSYRFDNGGNEFVNVTFQKTSGTAFVWQGNNSQFFWTTNYSRVMWATNSNPGAQTIPQTSVAANGDGIRWYDSTAGSSGWINFLPALTGTDFLLGAKIILSYKNRLIMLNIRQGVNLAGQVSYAQRVTWSQNGTPFYDVNVPSGWPGGFNVNAWRTDLVGRGGFLDAPTGESIVSAEFIKDTLIVYFERSTWQLVYTGNEVLPFLFQKINTELGCESQFSIVPFDRGVFGVGNYGIIATNSENVVRLDQKIPDEVFRIQNDNEGPNRVYGIRDYNAQLVYWSYPVKTDYDGDSISYDLTFPNQVLVYNYLDDSWAQFDDSFTAFGYWQNFQDNRWEDLPFPWESVQSSWESGVYQARYPDIAAGNQRGFVQVYSQLKDLGQNDTSLIISNYDPTTSIVTARDHNLTNNEFVLVTGVQGTTGINNVIFKVTSATVNTFVITNIDGSPAGGTGTYTGGGFLTHIPNIFVRTKSFNPNFAGGDAMRINYIEVYAQRTDSGEVNVQFFTSDNISDPVETVVLNTKPEPIPTYSLPNPNYQMSQEKIWHRVYSNAFGSFVQNVFTLSDEQITNLNIANSQITIHGIIYYVTPSGRLSYDI